MKKRGYKSSRHIPCKDTSTRRVHELRQELPSTRVDIELWYEFWRVNSLFEYLWQKRATAYQTWWKLRASNDLLTLDQKLKDLLLNKSLSKAIKITQFHESWDESCIEWQPLTLPSSHVLHMFLWVSWTLFLQGIKWIWCLEWSLSRISFLLQTRTPLTKEEWEEREKNREDRLRDIFFGNSDEEKRSFASKARLSTLFIFIHIIIFRQNKHPVGLAPKKEKTQYFSCCNTDSCFDCFFTLLLNHNDHHVWVKLFILRRLSGQTNWFVHPRILTTKMRERDKLFPETKIDWKEKRADEAKVDADMKEREIK